MDDDNPFANPFADDNDPSPQASLPPIITTTTGNTSGTTASPNQSPYIRKLERDGVISLDLASPSSSGFGGGGGGNPFSSVGDGNPFASSSSVFGDARGGAGNGAEEVDAFSGGFGGDSMAYQLPPAATAAPITPDHQTSYPFQADSSSPPVSPSTNEHNTQTNVNTAPTSDEQKHDDAERLRALGLAPEEDSTAGGLKAAFVKREHSVATSTGTTKVRKEAVTGGDASGKDETVPGTGTEEQMKKEDEEESCHNDASKESVNPDHPSSTPKPTVADRTVNAEPQKTSSQTTTSSQPQTQTQTPSAASPSTTTTSPASASMTKAPAPIRRRKKIVGISVGDSERERELERARERERERERAQREQEQKEREKVEKERAEKERAEREQQPSEPQADGRNDQPQKEEGLPISAVVSDGHGTSLHPQDGKAEDSVEDAKGGRTVSGIATTAGLDSAGKQESAIGELVQETSHMDLDGTAKAADATDESITAFSDAQHQSQVDPDGLRGLPALPDSEANTRTGSPDTSHTHASTTSTSVFPTTTTTTTTTTTAKPPTSPPAKTARSPTVHSRRVVSGHAGGGGVWGRAFDEVEDEPLSAAPVSSRMPGSAGWPTAAGSGGWGEERDVSGFGYGAAVSGSPGFAGMAGASSSPPQEQIQSAAPPAAKPTPAFNIRIHDPTRVGDPIRGHVVYTVTTRTTSPHFHSTSTAIGAGAGRGGMVEASVLRRFSQFLWLVERLGANNPGVIVPPVPDKQISGRFEDQFVETRRAALEKCLNKIANHPVLALDPDLRLFLESEAFEYEVKHRKHEASQSQDGGKGLLASLGGSIGGPRFIEKDDWFEQKKAFLDSLESQMKGLIKSVEAASKHRLDLATTIADFSGTITALSESDLSMDLSQALQRFAGLINREKEREEGQAKMDVVKLLSTADEYLRWIGSVRMAFAGRIKSYHAWQQAESDSRRLKTTHEKLRRAGKIAHERLPLAIAEIHEADRKALDLHADFDAVSRLCKTEFGAYEQGRVEEFKTMLGEYLDGMIIVQKEMIAAWENYLGLVQRTTGDRPTQRSS
ncbi:hypothetical protein QFC22_005251 [Naganishia vaughanmartiniae]|uniref:Uncharacterized protein n=1 Tax=Naganishia vaughanmartiniae TaxID=1424756 RepID=A0ACC2WUM9_9TREE|nr:hypothetical protein QFC22_005251 [Naganishia vaughanmartiniae]